MDRISCAFVLIDSGVRMSTNATPHPLLDIACTAQAHTHTRLLHFLEDSEISEDVTTTIKDNDLGGKEFLCLNERNWQVLEYS